MPTDDFSKRIEELAARAFSRGVFTYSEFLSPSNIARVKDMRLPVSVCFYGGGDFCERKVARFGNPDAIGYEEDFPVRIVKIEPTSKKFAKPLSHRDFLGAVIGLGIERDKVGDIFTDGMTAYVAVNDKLAAYITQNLQKAGANTVVGSIADNIPQGFEPKISEVSVTVSSLRLDAIICRLYNLSREQGLELFKEGKVSVDGKLCENASHLPKGEQIISVRGYGKFCFKGETGTSKKGKLYVLLNVYV